MVVASSDTQREAVDIVLEEFFDLTEAGYAHHRCDEELAKCKAKAEKAAASAKAKWSRVNANADQNDANASKPDANAMRPLCEGNANQEPITNSQEPITNIALASDKRTRKTDADGKEDPEHWSVSQTLLTDHEPKLDDWEIDFLHSIKWKPSLSKPQEDKLKAIRAKVAATGPAAVALPTVRRGSAPYDAWIAHYRRTKPSAKFYETLEVLTVPTEYPPQGAAA